MPAGNNASVFGSQLPANTTYYFAAGTHYLGSGAYAQINPGSNDTFIGAPGAIIAGDDPGSSGYTQNYFAFVGDGAGVTGITIEYLTIENFAAPGSQGAVNTNSNDNWTVTHNTIKDNVPGAAMMVGSSNTIEYNCMTGNGQYAFNAYQSPGDPQSSKVTGGPQNIVLSGNEIAYNGTCNWEAFSKFPIKPPTGCAGAGPMALLLGDVPGLEQVELDAPGDDRDAGLAWFPGGEVAGFLGLAGAGPVRAVANVEAGHEDLEQECGEGLAELVRGGKPRPWRSRRPVRAGS